MSDKPTNPKVEILKEFRSRIKYLENLSKAIYQKKVQVNADTGTVDVSLSSAELKNLAEVESQLFKMRKDAEEYEDGIGEEE